jgi:hypothetical protein
MGWAPSKTRATQGARDYRLSRGMYDDYIMWFNPGKCVPMSQDPIVSFTHIVKLKGYIMEFDTTDCEVFCEL